MRLPLRLSGLAAASVVAASLSSAQTANQPTNKNAVFLNAAKPAERGNAAAHIEDRSGRSLYAFMRDKGGNSTCVAACARHWPPLLTYGHKIIVGPGVDQHRVGTVKRIDGTVQVTYGGWPLYYYYEDGKAGEMHGENIVDSGGRWSLVAPTGQLVAASAH